MSDPHAPCMNCAEEHPIGVLEDGLCPSCVDDVCSTCGAQLDCGDGYDGECASCADITENEHEQD